MYHLTDLKRFLSKIEPSRTLCLATIVGKRGSSYSSPGRRMLIAPNGSTLGALSGGCIEGHLIERGQVVCLEHKSELLTLDSTAEDDLAFGFNMGCRGAIEVLLQPIDLDQSRTAEALEHILCRSIRGSQSVVLLQPAPLLGATATRTGDDDVVWFGPQVPDFDRQFIEQALYQEDPSESLDQSKVFCTRISATPTVRVFGATPCAGFLSQLCRIVGFACHIFDHRSHFRENLAGEFGIQAQDIRPQFVNEVTEPNAIWVLMSHNFECDFQLVCALLPQNPRYLGILGSRQRFDELRWKLPEVLQQHAKDIYSPIGINTGGRSPEEIAFAILAEIKLCLNRVQPRHLKTSV